MSSGQGGLAGSLKTSLALPEKQIILEALESNGWNRQNTANLLGINRTTLYKKMKKYGIEFEKHAFAHRLATVATDLRQFFSTFNLSKTFLSSKEYRISNKEFRMMKFSNCATGPSYSTSRFIIPCSIFNIPSEAGSVCLS